MKRSRTLRLTMLSLVVPVATLVAGQSQVANGQQLRFQKPSDSQQSQRENQANMKFRSPGAPTSTAKQERKTDYAPKLARADAVQREAKPIATPASVSPSFHEPKSYRHLVPESVRRVQHVPDLAEELDRPDPASSSSPVTDDYEDGGIEIPCAGCGMYSSSGGCGCEVGCGVADVCCGDCEPDCGCAEPVCGIAEPTCGSAPTECGSCVGLPGPDYWCFPVCLPRFKDLTVWGGVQGFRGPRDFYAPASAVPGSRSDSNFGFHEGINFSGRAPFIGLLFPQLSYQLGYQAAQSRLSGTVVDSNDRSQQFVTAGFFRRVQTGLQFGVVWDMMRDDLYVEDDLHQIRSEISLKSPEGREIGFWTANSTNSIDVLGITYQAVDQYAFFYRCNFGKSSNGRIWVGGTNDSETILGAEFNAPINDRWSVQTGFNYLIPEQSAGLAGVSEESWNIGINVVWHLGRTAQTCYQSPYRPLFPVADNGWMFVDQN